MDEIFPKFQRWMKKTNIETETGNTESQDAIQ